MTTTSDLLRALVEAVIPADGLPSAAETGVAEAVVALLAAERPEWQPRLDAELARVEAEALSRGASFTAMDDAGRLAVLDALTDDADHRWFCTLVGDLYLADPATPGSAAPAVWDSVGWRRGVSVDDVDTSVFDLPASSFARPVNLADAYDVVVIGAGAGGGVAAAELAASGRRVLLVERGDWPSTASLGRDHLRTPRASTGLDPLTGPRGFDDPRTVALGIPRQVWPGDGAWGANAMTVGGGTRIYGAQAWRFSPDDFRMASRYGVPGGSALADWPITYDDLEPYYSRAEVELGVSGAAGGDPWAGHRSVDYPMPPVHETVQSRLLADGARALGWSTVPVPLLVNSRPYNGRAACVHCAQCIGFACPVDAKTGTHNTALRRALATGLCTLLPSARVERLVTDLRGRVVGVALVGGTGAAVWRQVVSAGEVVLSAGAIESARLLLASASASEPDGLGNGTDQVGRHLQAHLYAGASALFPTDVVDLVGPGPAIATCDFRHGNDGLVGGGMLANEFVPTPGLTRRYLTEVGFIPPHGLDAVRGLREQSARMVRVMGPFHEVTSADSRVRLDPSVVDGHGNAVVALSGALHAEDLRGQAFMAERAAEWLTASGATQVRQMALGSLSSGPSAGQHQAGTCRMGTDPATSVTDSYGRVWGHGNLRVVDASTHVTNGGVNPVLTVLANALRVAEHMVSGTTASGGGGQSSWLRSRRVPVSQER